MAARLRKIPALTIADFQVEYTVVVPSRGGHRLPRVHASACARSLQNFRVQPLVSTVVSREQDSPAGDSQLGFSGSYVGRRIHAQVLVTSSDQPIIEVDHTTLFRYNARHLRNAIVGYANSHYCPNMLILVICLERLMGIMYPLSARRHKKSSKIAVIVTIIVVTTGVLTSYNHFSYFCATRYFCNGSQFHAMCLPTDSERWFRNQTNPNSELMKTVVRWGPHVNAVCVILIPIALVFISNAMLIYTIRQRQKQFITQSSIKSESHLSGSQSRTEHKVTTTVCAIVTCFTITQGPSAVIRVMAVYYPIQHEFMIAVQSVITTMVVLGKALNFVLFCLSSANFRARLLQQARRGLLKKETSATLMSDMIIAYLNNSAKSVGDITPYYEDFAP
ncbi:hypothetical protein ANCCAN_08559 [Ancylostoma caninum]|uniref:G-protein coupled receptors family 1 profile domain-containing protein n=1 Tax=Ancylostoma caninum TaxID=29170 RepID=A0A368GQ49_ANCCA|nr:hypothetical protein ANCCAN_08559 [Ancylostoma caninum]